MKTLSTVQLTEEQLNEDGAKFWDYHHDIWMLQIREQIDISYHARWKQPVDAKLRDIYYKHRRNFAEAVHVRDGVFVRCDIIHRECGDGNLYFPLEYYERKDGPHMAQYLPDLMIYVDHDPEGDDDGITVIPAFWVHYTAFAEAYERDRSRFPKKVLFQTADNARRDSVIVSSGIVSETWGQSSKELVIQDFEFYTDDTGAISGEDIPRLKAVFHDCATWRKLYGYVRQATKAA